MLLSSVASSLDRPLASVTDGMAMAGLMGIVKSIIGICETKPLDLQLWEIEGSTVRVKVNQVTELSSKGGAVYLKGKGLDDPVLIVRTQDDEYLAFANKCPHGRRKIDPVPGEPMLRCCSIGHSTFDHDGNVTKGPAKEPIVRYAAELNEGNLIVTL